MIERVRDWIRLKHYSIRPSQAHSDWTKRFILFHGKRPSAERGAMEVYIFLTHLAVELSIGLYTKSSEQRSSVSLPRSAQCGVTVARQCGEGERAHPFACGVNTRQGVAGAHPIAGYASADRSTTFGHRVAHHGSAAPTHQKSRVSRRCSAGAHQLIPTSRISRRR